MGLERGEQTAATSHDTRGRVVVLGGHGKVARLLAPKLTAEGFAVDSVIRNPGQQGDIETLGARPVVFDMEHEGKAAFGRLFAGAVAVVFSAGAGGGDASRTHAVDYEAAVKAMDAAQAAGVKRFVMVSYDTASEDPQGAGWPESFVPYAQAKHDADAHLRASGLDYTILGPGSLTLEPESDKVLIVGDHATVDGRPATREQRRTSRGNVAAVAAYVIAQGRAVRRTVNFYDGPTPIDQAIGKQA